MANSNFTFDVAKGREVELYNRVNDNDPTNSALILVVLASGHETDDVLRTYDNLDDLLNNNAEATNTNYARKTLTDADLNPAVVDTSAHTTTLPFPNQTWTSVAAGDTWSKLLICYDDDSTSGTDADIVPVMAEVIRNQSTGIALVPSGGNVVFSWPYGLAIVR